MNKVVASGILIAGLGVTAPSWAFSFSSCDEGSDLPKPEWVNNPDYVRPGYQVGMDSVSLEGKNKGELKAAAESNARKNLVQQLQIVIRTEDSQSTRLSGESVTREAASKITASSEEDLRGLKSESWVDKKTCIYYTLAYVSDKSLAQSKVEKNMKLRLEKFKELLAEGKDDKKNRDIKARRKYLEDAQSLLDDIDFKLLPDELAKSIYSKRLEDARAEVAKESAKSKGRMALFALNEDHTLKADVLGRMLDQLRSGDIPTVRLMADCTSQSECMDIAKDLGYTMLTMLTISSEITTSQMGSLKGTLTVIKTVYDIESRKAIKASDKTSTQVIGWSREELDWGAAAEKAMQNFK